MKLVKESLYEQQQIPISDEQFEDMLEMMEGSEIESDEYDGTVYVQNGIAYKAFSDQPIKLDKSGWLRLWKEYMKTHIEDKE